MNLQARPLLEIVEIENVFITLSDGCRLAARIWMPEGAEAAPVPAVLEYIPYRKRDGTAGRDATVHPFVAAHGYACVRVDMRGNGESDGLMEDEYTAQELTDGAEVIGWIAEQPWCSGPVGMIGISWGGFNGLQIAVLRPPALRAVITLCSTDDRYADDIHYRGGCLLNDNLAWSATMTAYSSRPPDPALVGERWREMWLHRLANMPFLAANWLEHQRRDEFWQHGSVCEDYSAIEVPVLAVGGWVDSYSNAIPRLVAGLGHGAGLIGPWGHKYPHMGVPGPAMDFRREMLRWWDRWLAGLPADEPPALRAYILDGPDTGSGPDERAGYWVCEPAWPSPNIATRALSLGDDLVAPGERTVASPATTGLAGGRFYPKLGRPDIALDQRPDDANSLALDGAPLAEPLELLGAPVVEVELAADRPQASVAVRLCHVAPDGASHRISMGVLNLAHRDGHREPAPLTPGARYRVRVQLDDIGYRVPAGHRLRLAISSAYWPMIWPSPEPVTLTVGPGVLRLPVRQAQGQSPVAIERTEPVEAASFVQVRPASSVRRICYDAMTGETVVEQGDDAGLKRFDGHGLEAGIAGMERFGICAGDPLSAWAEMRWTTETGRGDWRVRTENTSRMHSDRDAFHIEAELVAYENDEEVFRQRWQRTVARDNV